MKKEKNKIFFDKDTNCEMIEEIVLGDSSFVLESDSFFADDLVGCDKRLFHKIIGEGSESSRMGDLNKKILIKKWEYLFKEINFIEVLDKEFIFADQNYNVYAKIDFVCKINSEPYLFLVKSCNDDQVPKRRDIVVSNIKMWLSEVNICYLIYDDLFKNNISIYKISPRKPIINSIKDKLMALKKHKLTGLSPKKKYKEFSDSECAFCFLKKKCWRENE